MLYLMYLFTLTVTIRAPRMPSVAARALAAHDRGQAAGGRAVRGLLRSRGAQGAQEPLRTPQGARRKGNLLILLLLLLFR